MTSGLSFTDFVKCLRDNNTDRLENLYDARRLEDLGSITLEQLHRLQDWANELVFWENDD